MEKRNEFGLSENAQLPVTPLDALNFREAGKTFEVNSTNQLGKIINLKRKACLGKTQEIKNKHLSIN